MSTTIESIREQLKDLGSECATKQTEKSAMNLERDLRTRIDNKIEDAEEKQRRDSKDLYNKHTMLKQEMSLSMLDNDMLGFLKGFQKEWNKLLYHSDQTGEKLGTMSTKLEDLDTQVLSLQQASVIAKSKPSKDRLAPRNSSKKVPSMSVPSSGTITQKMSQKSDRNVKELSSADSVQIPATITDRKPVKW